MNESEEEEKVGGMEKEPDEGWEETEEGVSDRAEGG